MNVRLRRDAWHGRVQRWTFPGGTPGFQNFCPYFWLTVFCLTVSPFVLVARSFMRLLRLVGAVACWAGDMLNRALVPIDAWLEKLSRQRVLDAADMLTDERAMMVQRMWDYLYGLPEHLTDEEVNAFRAKDRSRSKLFKMLDAWKKKNPRLKEREAARQAELRRKWAEDDRRQASIRRRQRMFSLIAQYTKYVMVLPALGLAGGLGYGVYFLVSLLVESWHLIPWLVMLQALGIIVLILVGIVGLIAVCANADSLCRLFDRDIFVGSSFERLCHGAYAGMGAGAGAVARFFGFFWSYIRFVKQNYCPHIEWVDDEKRP